MAGIIRSTLKNCTETFGASYSTAGTPFTTANVFSKTITSEAGFVFTTPPTIDFSGTSRGSYSFTFVDTPSNGVKNKNLTSRAYTVNYTYGLTQPTQDVVKFFATAKRIHSDTTTNVYGYDLKENSIKQGGEKRNLLVYGDAGVSFSVLAKVTGGSNLTSTSASVKTASSSSTIVILTVSNPKIFVGMSVTGTGVGASVTVAAISGTTLTLSAAKSLDANTVLTIGATGSFTATLDGNGKFVLPITFPRVSSPANYTVTLTEIASESFSGSLTSPTSIIIYQYINTVTTLSTTQSGSDFVISGNNIVHTIPGNTVRQTSDDILFYVSSNAAAGVNAAGTATIRPIKTIGSFNTSDLGGIESISGQGAILTNGTDIKITGLERSLSQGTTRTTSGNSSTTAITLSSTNAAIKPGMKVTGTNINNVVTVASITGTALVLSGAPGATVASGTTLTFAPVATIIGRFGINKSGSANDTVSILANNIIALNEAPVAVSVAAQSIPSNDPVNVSLPATDAESDSLIYVITQLPLTVSGDASHGTLKYGEENTAITSVPTVLPPGTKVVKYQKPANSTTATDFKFKVNDGYQNSNEATIIMNLTN